MVGVALPVHPARPGPFHLLSAVGCQRLRARLWRSSAAGRPDRRPARPTQGVPGRAGVFAVASLLGGLVDDGALLIAARFVKGVSAAFTAPAALSIITTTFAEGPERNKALSIFTACGASGYSLGLVLSGLLTEIGWRWTLLMPVPVAIIALIAGAQAAAPPQRGAGRRRPRPDRRRADHRLDAAAGLHRRRRRPRPAGPRCARSARWSPSPRCSALFVVAELRVEAPPGTARHPALRPLVRANLGLLILFGSYVAFQFVAMQYFQNLLGWSALEHRAGVPARRPDRRRSAPPRWATSPTGSAPPS